VDLPRVVRQYVEAFTHGDIDAYMATFSESATYTDPGTGGPLTGAAIRTYLDAFLAGFPDLQCEALSVEAVSERRAVWRWRLRGTNTGSLMGRPATGKCIDLRGCEFLDVAMGRVQSVESYFDRLTMLLQLGLAPRPR
jgi:steroid delta-isomerase-like uncharacterized protein